MAITKLGKQNSVALSNVVSKAAEAEMKTFDTDGNGFLNSKEAKSYFEAKTGTPAPVDLKPEIVYQLAGGAQRSSDPYHFSYSDVSGAKLGNFQVPGLGAGNAVYSRERTHGTPDVFRFTFNCDFIDQSNVEDIDQATMVIARSVQNDFQREPGSDLIEKLAIPLDIRTTDPVRTQYGTTRPAEKVLQTGIPTKDLRSLAGGKDVAFYVELKMKDGTTKYINREGKAFQNFSIPYYAVNVDT